MRSILYTTLILAVACLDAAAQDDFRVPPYLQHPAREGMTIMWFSEVGAPGQIRIGDASGPIDSTMSAPTEATALEYPFWEVGPDDFPDGMVPDPPFRHEVRFEGLNGETEYWYEVTQGATTFRSNFRTAPGIRGAIRFIAYADSETEPNPIRPFAPWADPADPTSDRRYLVDQQTGYAANLAIMRERDPHFVAIAGDLVESGGEQRDWDEFWTTNSHPDPDSSLAGRAPIVAVPGNHEYYSSPHSFSNDSPKRYRQPWSEIAMDRYETYFVSSDNGSATAGGRYHRTNFGPVALIGLDVSNNGPNQGSGDTNFELLGDVDAGGGPAPSFGVGSEQYAWLETELADAQLERPFVFVMLHYVPYSVGPHGWPAGDGAGGDGSGVDRLSGVPVRELTPLFMKFGVDAVFAGHDEMWERSVVEGLEERPDGSMRDHSIHFYDLGTGGDGLRGPQEGLENPFQRFLAHTDAVEIWENETLVDGGKHYGHLEVEVYETERDAWEATLTPVYAFPVFQNGELQRFERRTYDDVVVLNSADSLRGLAAGSETPGSPDLALSAPYPNPMSTSMSVRLESSRVSDASVAIFDVLGRRVRTLHEGPVGAGTAEISWNGTDDAGQRVAPGTYFVRLVGANGSSTRAFAVARP